VLVSDLIGLDCKQELAAGVVPVSWLAGRDDKGYILPGYSKRECPAHGITNEEKSEDE